MDTTLVVEQFRADLINAINKACDDLKAKLSGDGTATAGRFKSPTQADGLDPRNKNGHNLTARGIEILYRAFDEGAGYNRAARLLNISQGAAKNRKGIWLSLGGTQRVKTVLDIDG